MRRAYRPWRRAIALGVVSWSACAWALNPALDVSQYAHTSWTIRDGFFQTSVHTIAQTPDGYLWLGTELGLRRFDGVRKIDWQPSAGDHLPGTDVSKLFVARDGRLWIGTLAGLASWKDGRLIHYPELDGQAITALLEDHAGTVWAGGVGVPTGRLCAIQSGVVQCFGQDGSLGINVSSLFEENGNLWVGAQTGLWRWRPSPPKRYAMPMPDPNDSVRVDAGPLLIAMHGGIKQLIDEKVEAYPIRGVRQSFDANRLLRDRNGSLWIGTLSNGILHLHQGRTDWFSQSDGLSGNSVSALLEDREGSIWVATSEGLDRFRDSTALHDLCETGPVQRRNFVRAGGNGWKRLDRRLRWFEPMAERTNQNLHQARWVAWQQHGLAF